MSLTTNPPLPQSLLLPGTLDHMRDAKPPSYRILLQTPVSDFSYVVSVAGNHQEITSDWLWLQENLLETLGGWAGQGVWPGDPWLIGGAGCDP